MAEPITSRSSTGLEENIAGLLCYLVAPLSGLVFFLIEKESRFVRFHAVQSMLLFLLLYVVQFIIGMTLGRIPLIGWLFGLVAWLIILVPWLLLMWRAYEGKRFKVPFIGDIAETQANKL